MVGPKRTPFQIEHDRREVASLYLRGVLQKDIAARLDVCQQQVSYDLAVIRRQWRNDTAIDLDEAKRKELAKIDELERAAWDAFERSQGMRERTRTGRRGGVGDAGDSSQNWAQIEREEMAGSPTFLAAVMACIKKRCELLGLDAPAQHELSGPGGGPVQVDHRGSLLVDKMTDAEVDQAIAEAERLTQGR